MALNNTIEALTQRRSIRLFRTEQISKEELCDILYTAKYAPSAMGLQARHFTVVQNKNIISDIISAAEKNGAKFLPEHTPFYNAPTIIILSAPYTAKYCREDCSCAIMNIMLASYAYGIGSCYICSVLDELRDSKIMKQLKLPNNYIPFGCVAIGYPKANASAPKERRSDDITYIR